MTGEERRQVEEEREMGAAKLENYQDKTYVVLQKRDRRPFVVVGGSNPMAGQDKLSGVDS